MNYQELCDEEKNYNAWVVDNLYYIRDHKDCIRVMKKVYMDGFAAGFVYKQKLNAEEYLQK